MTDNVAATPGDKGEPGHRAESAQTGDSGATVNPARPADDAANQGRAAADAPSEVNPALPQVPYGAWPSPITAAQVAGGRNRVAYPTIIGDTVWWQEDKPEEGGRTTVMRCGLDGVLTTLLPAPWTARTRVHEYGGRSYLPVRSAVAEATLTAAGHTSGDADIPVVFANLDDQRLYLAGADVASGKAEPVPLTPEPKKTGSAFMPEGATGPGKRATGSATPLEARGLRYADLVLSPDKREVWCVRERHHRGKVSRAIVAVPLDGSAATEATPVRVLVTGHDFFAFPTPSPDGQWLAWICWNHPHMPWDGTELRVAPVEDGTPGKSRLIKGSNRESVLAPLWRDNASLYVATDWTGWWNIYQIGLRGEPPQALYPADEEFADPLWELGARPFAMLGDGRLAVRHGRGGARLGLLDPETSELTDLELPFTDFLVGVSADVSEIAAIGAAPLAANSVIRIDVTTGSCTVLRAEFSELPDPQYLPVPRQVELEGPYGRIVHALVYPPANPDVTNVQGELAPYVVWVHGGPTGHVTARLSLEKAYFTSRGIGIIDVNYGGSTGYGRLYRNRLNREWGVVDVADAKEAARSLARQGLADEARLGIRGGSAGGWTALAAVTTGAVHDPVFSAAVSYFGVSDLRGFNEHTHDFESRYLDGLIGPLPGFDTVYAERAPVGHVNANTCPVLLLQGLDDPVVPPQQSESIAADLTAHGIRHAYIAFEGESHGFRKAESMITSLEAELSFYGQIMGFTPGDVPELKLTDGVRA
ncbi:MAG TPA: prolyl oligopeptidase family serine peptidase [Streptosporangiaceae bacterium]|jgi:dipeptidyl aminopeptidase/acylaminoacyl peptidase|nr:prolyl oligopeptidase family serine peptidase [Streptosporangiaceae bacterium]